MAIAWDATGGTVGTDPSQDQSWTHVCTGSNLMLVVGIMSNTLTDPLTVKYNSVDLTKAKAGTDNSRNCSIWYLANPSTGSNTVAVHWNASTALPTGSSVSYTGCQTGIGANTNSNTATSGTTYSVAVTTTVANSYLVGVFQWNNGATITASGGSTVRNQQGSPNIGESLTDLLAPTIQSNTLAVTVVSNQGFWIVAAIEILPSSSSTPLKALMGVGQ